MFKEENLVEEIGTETTTTTESNGLSQYEIERNKPMPNFIHGVIQKQDRITLKTPIMGRSIFFLTN